MRDLQARVGPGPGRVPTLLPSDVSLSGLRVEISLVHNDLTQKTVPKDREEPLCQGKLCLNRDICVCAVLVGHGGLPLLPSDVSLSGTPGRDFACSR